MNRPMTINCWQALWRGHAALRTTTAVGLESPTYAFKG